ncbi:hypothetical protein D7I46_04745 [Lactococcus allomyrinae]|uniref:Uncharacterized protein n=1 Tax=Lactococcus allomyrinae TaxID=2419773 RepID=A0A387B9E3_9LACT|nr:hypothetical protein D7I46_04745 [Lactococcus allomyrinae]
MRNSQLIWEEFDHKMRKIRPIAIGVIVLLLGTLMFLLIQNTQKKTRTTKPTIALVNEDQAGMFNWC